MKFPETLSNQANNHPYPMLFATISGSHLYGFDSADSDYDLRGAHLLPLRDVIGLTEGKQTIERTSYEQGLEIDLVTHDVLKFFGLMLKKNGYVLEQVFSPLVVKTTPEHEELKSIASQCLTRHHAHHYFGFSQNQWKLFQKEDRPRVKPLLYVFRVILTGIHLMRTGIIEANLKILNEEFQLSYLDDLIAQKTQGPEKAELTCNNLAFIEQEYERLRDQLQREYDTSQLPENPTGKSALNDLLIRLRLRESAPE